MESNTKMPYFANIQALRGIAALSVVLYHLSSIESKYFSQHMVPKIFSICGTAGVDLFFVISGFVMMMISNKQFGKGSGKIFLLHRALRIYPAYWFYTLIALSIFIIMPQWVNASTGHKINILASFTLLPSETFPLLMQGWTLTFEMFFYIVFAIFINWSSVKMVTIYLYIWAIVTLVFFWCFNNQHVNPYLSMISNLLILEFIAGCLAANIYLFLKPQLACVCFLVTIFLSVISFLFVSNNNLNIDHWRILFFGIPSFLLVLSVASLERQNSLIAPRFMQYLGNASYSLYLSHILVMSAIGRACMRFMPNLSSSIGILICLITAIITGIFSYHFLEKPLTLVFKRWACK